MPIPFYKIPTDLAGEILSLCDPIQLFVISKCSRRTQKLVKSKVANKWKISSLTSTEIYLKGGRRKEFRFKMDDDPRMGYRTLMSIMGSCIYLTYPYQNVYQLLSDLVDVFGCKSVPFIKASEFDDFENFLDLCRVVIKKDLKVERLRLYCENHEMSGFLGLWKQMNISKIHICHSSSVTMEQLLECTSVLIVLEDSILTNKDLDLFLQKWKTTGAFSNLKRLEIRSKKINKRSKILDMVPPIGNAGDRVYRECDPDDSDEDDEDTNIDDKVRIIKEDGTKAYLSVRLGTWSEIKFLVIDPANTVMEE